MATRLYPLTQDPQKLEVLAGVPAGTFQELKAFEALAPEIGSQEEYAHWCRKQEILHVAKLDRFLVFGWGRMGVYQGPCGETTILRKQ
jgi:hypothetical protein